MHLPAPYGYNNGTNTSFRLVYHLVNKAAVAKNLSIEVVYQYRPVSGAGLTVPPEPAVPLWLDVDGCADSEYPAPVGYSDTHFVPPGTDWTLTVNGRLIGMTGHMHDVDVTSASPCTDHCPAQGHGIALKRRDTANPAADYFGPSPPANAPPADLAGATVCRRRAYYGRLVGGCGRQPVPRPPRHDERVRDQYRSAARRPGAGLAGRRCVQLRGVSAQGRPGAPAALGVPEQHRRGQNDVMGIMMAYLAPQNPGYPRPAGASPMRASLVPAYNQCTSPNRVHGPPDFPGNASNPDGPATRPRRVRARSRSAPRTPTGRARTRPARCACGDQRQPEHRRRRGQRALQGVDHRRALQARREGLRGRQRRRGRRLLRPAAGQERPADHRPLQRPLRGRHGPGHLVRGHGARARARRAPAWGANCSIDTTADAVLPGVVKEVRRSNWQLGQVQVFDGGADGVVSTNPNTLFAVQGVFVP